VAKTANNKKGDSGKARQTGKPAQSKKAVAKRADAKPARTRGQQKAPAKGKTGERRGVGKFLHDVRVEMGKVTWPTRKDLAQSTLVVLVAVAIATAYTGVLDFAFDKAVAFVVGLIT
jgi:preprotein translocase subunit SecE